MTCYAAQLTVPQSLLCAASNDRQKYHHFQGAQLDATMLLDVDHALPGLLASLPCRSSSSNLSISRLAARCRIRRTHIGIYAICGAALTSWRTRAIWSGQTEDKQGLFEDDSKMAKGKHLVSKLRTGNQIEIASLSVARTLNQLEDMAINKDSDVSILSPSDMSNGLSSETYSIQNAAIIVFDIETTGLRPSYDRIIELAARDLAGGECSTLQTLVNPEMPVPLHVSKVHGIHSDMVNKSDIPRWKEVAPVLIQFIESRRRFGGPVFLVAHNGKTFDVPFLINEFQRCSIQIPAWWRFIDSMPIAREAVKAKGLKGASVKLSALHQYYNLPFVGEAHRALADVHMLASVLQMLMIDLKMSVSEFLDRSFTVLDMKRPTQRYTKKSYAKPTFKPEVDKNSVIPWEHDQITLNGLKDDQLSVSQNGVTLAISNEYSKVNQALNLQEPQTSITQEPRMIITDRDFVNSNDNGLRDDNVENQLGLVPMMDMGLGCSNQFPGASLRIHEVDLSKLDSELRMYVDMKLQKPELLLLWQMEDYSQAFFEDAMRLSEICGAAVAAVKGGEFLDGLVPVATLHNSQVNSCIQALLREGISVLKHQISKTTGDSAPSEWKDIVTTPGMTMGARRPKTSSKNYVMSILLPSNEDGIWGLAYTDISTGDIFATEARGRMSMIEEILLLQPSEIVYSATVHDGKSEVDTSSIASGFCYTCRASNNFDFSVSIKMLKGIFGPDVLERFGLEEMPIATRAAGGLVGYIDEVENTLNLKLAFNKITLYMQHDYMLVDQRSRNDLEIFKTDQGEAVGSLLWVVDHCKTSMGKRMLKEWISRPLLDRELICARQDAVEVLINDPELRASVQCDLSFLNDLERLACEIVSKRGTHWDLIAMQQSISLLPQLLSKLEGLPNRYFLALKHSDVLLDLAKKIQNLLQGEDGCSLQPVQIIQDKVDKTLDLARSEVQSLDSMIKEYESRERDILGLQTLEIKQDIMGLHYITIGKNELIGASLPSHYQECFSAISEFVECFVTTSLNSMSKQRWQAIEKAKSCEAEILNSLLQDVHSCLSSIQETANAVAALDVLASFAEVAVLRDYCKPVIVEDSTETTIISGRNPIAELLLHDKSSFRSNSLYMGNQVEESEDKAVVNNNVEDLEASVNEISCPRPDVLILSGPPSSGKSCFLKQIALIQILAQIGSYVPAQEAYLGVADSVYMISENPSYRNLSFLNAVTNHSIVLIDGFTPAASSHENTAILRAMIEYLARTTKTRTVITTGSSDLGSLEEEFQNISSFFFSGNDYHLQPGFCVQPSLVGSRIAGIPDWISSRVSELLCESCQTEQFSSQQLSRNTVHEMPPKETPLEQNNATEIPETETPMLQKASPLIQNGARKMPETEILSLEVLEDLEEIWNKILQVLLDYPATHALAKQKGTLLSIQRSAEVCHIHMTTSSLFIKKFLQHEHAAVLEAAFLSVLQSPINLKITAETEN